MGKYLYTVTPSDITNTSLEGKVGDLVGSFPLNTSFLESTNRIDLEIRTLSGELLSLIENYGEKYLAQRAPDLGIQTLFVNPSQDVVTFGYEAGDVKLTYRFVNDLFSVNEKTPFLVESISEDRQEVRIINLNLSATELLAGAEAIKTKIAAGPYSFSFNINLGEGINIVGVNIDTQDIDLGTALIVKAYEALPSFIQIGDTLYIEEVVADPSTFEVTATYELDPIVIPQLRGPNFELEVPVETGHPTEYLSYSDLINNSITSSQYQLDNILSQQGISISIDHTDYSNFIHFSSATERLLNFQYKLGLLEQYESAYSSSLSSASAVSGSSLYYQNLIQGVVGNLDHYEKHLYFESGSTCWPKSNNTRPYVNRASTSTEGLAWLSIQQSAASEYDSNNPDRLTNTIPSYLREDENNTPYLMFVDMVGQHFDNIWTYSKAFSDRYSADNRLDSGISKDLVRSAIEELGVKLYESPLSAKDLAYVLTGGSPISPGEVIHTTITASLNQPIPESDRQKEIYKRIYHNMPLLLKTKGTERGLRVLMNCYGIPSEHVTINQYGGIPNSTQLGPQFPSLDKIRTDNLETAISGSVLSRYTSVKKETGEYSKDLHVVEAGFNLSTPTNNIISSSLSSSFNIDNYIGDPSQAQSDEYVELNTLARGIGAKHGVAGLVRLLKYYDTTFFRMVKDFIPARASLKSGIIVSPHLLNRSKAKQVSLSYEDQSYSASIEIGEIKGESGNSIPDDYVTSYTSSVSTPLGVSTKKVLENSPRITGELNGAELVCTAGELNTANTYKHATSSLGFSHSQYDITQNSAQDSRKSVQAVNLNLNSSYTESAEYQDQLHDSIGMSRARFEGSRAYAQGVNLPGNIGSYGGLSPVEVKKGYFAYIDEISDPYPVVNDKTYLNVKYLIDSETNIENPATSVGTYYNLIDTFETSEDINSRLNVPKRESQFIKLNSVQTINKTGKILVPILYSQNSAISYVNEIPISILNNNIDTENINYSEIADENINTNILENTTPSSSRPLSINPVKIVSNIQISPDAEENPPIDNSTGIISAADLDGNYGIEWYINIPIERIYSSIQRSGIEIYLQTSPTGELGSWISTPNINMAYAQYTTFDTNGSNIHEWDIKNSLTSIGNKIIHQFSEQDFETDLTEIYGMWTFLFTLKDEIITGNYYKLVIEIDNQTTSKLNPSSMEYKPVWTINIFKKDSPTIIQFTPSGTPPKYWDYNYISSTKIPNQILLKSIGGNLLYGDRYYQTNIPYISGKNSHFKGGTEPLDIEFPDIKNPWNLELNDEIRFENNEDKSYIIINIEDKLENNIKKKLLTLDRDITSGTNLDFFLIRRYTGNPNNIIINQTFPYTNPLTSASLAPSTTGFIFPKYPTDPIAKNPDKIIRDLIDKKII